MPGNAIPLNDNGNESMAWWTTMPKTVNRVTGMASPFGPRDESCRAERSTLQRLHAERHTPAFEEELARFLLRLQQAGRTDEQVLRLEQRSAGSRRRAAWSHDPFRPTQRSPSKTAEAMRSAECVAVPKKLAPEASSSTASIEAWRLSDVQGWLREQGFAEYAEAFARHRVDGALLVQIDDEDLQGELGVTSRLQRKRLLTAIRTLAGKLT